jgi:hypothetical protein
MYFGSNARLPSAWKKNLAYFPASARLSDLLISQME